MHQFSDKTAKWPFRQTTVWGVWFQSECLSAAGVRGGSTVAAAAKRARRVCFPPPQRIQPLAQPCWGLRHHLLSVIRIKQFSVNSVSVPLAWGFSSGSSSAPRMSPPWLLQTISAGAVQQLPHGILSSFQEDFSQTWVVPSKAPLALSSQPNAVLLERQGFPHQPGSGFLRNQASWQHLWTHFIKTCHALTKTDKFRWKSVLPASHSQKARDRSDTPQCGYFFTHFKSSH